MEQLQMKELLAVIMILVLLTKLEKLLKYKILIPIDGKNVQEEYTSSLIDRKQLIIDVRDKMTDEETAEEYADYFWGASPSTQRAIKQAYLDGLAEGRKEKWHAIEIRRV